MFFQLISALHKHASVIITSNKGFGDCNESSINYSYFREAYL